MSERKSTRRSLGTITSSEGVRQSSSWIPRAEAEAKYLPHRRRRSAPVDPVTPASPSERPMGGQGIGSADALEGEA
jgi:hypothetical protein